MKRVGKFCICLAGGLVLNAGARAGNAVLPENPYAPIVARNVFGINPPAPVDPNQASAVPPPKITPNGIMSSFGRLQALFKVSIPAKPGQPAKDQSYILGEGEAQDDIEVTKIDEKGGLVTFNNHGTIQELPLANTAAAAGSSAPAQSGPERGPGPGGFPKPGFAFGGGNPGGNSGGNPGGYIHFGQSGGFGAQPPNNNNANNNGGANSGSRLGVAMGGGGGYVGSSSGAQPQNNTLSGEDQQALLAYQHAQALNGQSSLPPQIFPPTKFDGDAGVPPIPGGSASQ